MKVLHLIDSGGLYGAEKMLLALMSEQKASNIDATLLSCGDKGDSVKPLESEAEKLDLKCKIWRMKAGFNILGMLKIFDWAANNGFTHLHSHGFKFNVLIGLLPKYMRKKFRWVVTVHGFIPAKLISKSFIYQFLDKRMSLRADKMCLVSPAMAEYVEFIKAQNKCVVLNGIERKSSADISNETNQVDTSTSSIKLLYVGRLSHEKGIHYLLESLSELTSKEQKYHLTIMGDGPLKGEVLKTIDDKSMTSSITLKGFVDSPEQYFSQFDVLVMPSLTEGIPITLLEAMRERLPVIATKVGGIPFVLGYDYPYLVSPKSKQDLSDKLNMLCRESKENLDGIAQNNFERFLGSFTSQKMHESYLNIYRSI